MSVLTEYRKILGDYFTVLEKKLFRKFRLMFRLWWKSCLEFMPVFLAVATIAMLWMLPGLILASVGVLVEVGAVVGIGFLGCFVGILGFLVSAKALFLKP